jgi:hypothetical protein
MGRKLVRILVIALALVAFSKAASAQGPADGNVDRGLGPKTLVGAWFVDVTPTLVPPFLSLGTFSRDGTLTNISVPSLGSPPESPGYGVWGQDGRSYVCEHLSHFGRRRCGGPRRNPEGSCVRDRWPERRQLRGRVPGRRVRCRRSAHCQRHRYGAGAPHQGGTSVRGLTKFFVPRIFHTCRHGSGHGFPGSKAQ